MSVAQKDGIKTLVQNPIKKDHKNESNKTSYEIKKKKKKKKHLDEGALLQ